MPPTTRTHTEYLAFDGPIHVALAVAAGCALLYLFSWSLRRERNVLGKRNTVLFWVLRAVALIVVLWMLLAPAAIRAERSTTRRCIAVAVDVSPSMQTIDPPEAADDLRWSVAAAGTAADSVTANADRALAAATIAERRLSTATAALQNYQPERLALESAAAAQAAIARARSSAQAVADLLKRKTFGDGLAIQQERVAHILQVLDGSDFRRLAELAAKFKDGQDSLSSGWRESLSDLVHQMSGVRRRLAELARSAAEHEDPAAIAGSQSQSPRLARAVGLIESLDATLLRPLRESVDIRHIAFAGTATPLADQTAPAAAIRRLISRGSSDRSPGQGDGDQAANPVTDLAEVLQYLRREKRDQPLAAVFLLTDAGHNRPDSRDPRQAAAELSGTPVYVVPVGSSRHVRDVDLTAVSVPGVVMKDDDAVIEVALQAFDCEGESCRVELLREGTAIDHRDVEIASETATQRVRFNTKLTEVGLHRFQVRVVPLEAELTEENNFDQFEVNVTQNHIDLLVSDEMPRWEYRYLAQLFRRDPKLACDELLFRPRLIATGRRQESKSFPLTTDDWDRYDVVLLGDVPPEQLSIQAQESLVEFIRQRGGTLVMIAGDRFMPQAYIQQPLEELLPVTKVENAVPVESLDGYTFEVTDDGWRHHALMIADSEASTRTAWDFINRNAPFYSLSPYRRARPTARTLISAVPRTSVDANLDPAKSTFLCWQPVGRGRVVYLAGPETYRLRFLRGDRLHYRFWGQLLRWAIASDLAAGSELVSIRTDRPDYRSGDSVQVVVRLNDESGNAIADATLQAIAIDADESRVTVPLQPDDSIPGRYLGEFERLPTGIYRVEPSGADVERLLHSSGQTGETAAMASFTVRSPLNRELLDTRTDRALAEQIADATGGQVLPPTAVGEVLGLTDLAPLVTERTQTLPLWVQWKFLWIVFGCLSTEWVIRKRMGLS